jgi:hypothetical protein
MERKCRGEFYIDTNKHSISIKHMLDYIRENGGYKVFGNIFIIGGQYFDRAINYVDSNYLWHITKQLLLLSDQCSGDKMIQYCRILGIYRDKGQYTPTIVTSQKIKEKINKAYTMVRISTTELSQNESSSIQNFLDNCTFAGVLKTTGKMFSVAKGVDIPTKFDTNCFSMDGNDVVNWGLHTNNNFIKEQHHKLYTQKKGYKNQVEGLVRRQTFTKKCKALEEATFLTEENLEDLLVEVGEMEIDVKTKNKKIHTQLEKININDDTKTINHLNNLITQKKNTKISIFISQLQYGKKYNKTEILNILTTSGYENPSKMFNSIIKKSLWGPGHIFQEEDSVFTIRPELKSVWMQ